MHQTGKNSCGSKGIFIVLYVKLLKMGLHMIRPFCFTMEYQTSSVLLFGKRHGYSEQKYQFK